jgi:hypothetical protein
MRGPGQATVDFSLSKDSAIAVLGEGGRLEFRADFFNILNHANFNNPSESVLTSAVNANTGVVTESYVPTAGQITATRTKPRQIQLSLRLAF